MKIITCKEAIAQGLKLYYTGKLCPRGHDAERRTNNRVCYECHSLDVSARGKRIRQDPIRGELRRKRDRELSKLRMPQINAKTARRRAVKRAQSPAWCAPGTEAYAEMQDTYATAQALTDATGIKFVVDHIIPLSKGGLHTPDNLTPLTAETNGSKGATLDFEYPENDFESVTEIDEDDLDANDDNFPEVKLF